MHFTNELLLNLTAMPILQNLYKDRDYFLHFKKIETHLQKGSKVRDQNTYLFLPTCKHNESNHVELDLP